MLTPAKRGSGSAAVIAAAVASVCVAAVGQPERVGGARGAPAASQPAGQRELSNAELLREFIHFVRIDRPDAARAYGQQLLERGVPPAEFVDLVENSPERERFEETIGRALHVAEVDRVAGELLRLYEQGKLERVRDPREVTKNISLLTGTARNRFYARERLAAAGEYAMPQLLGALLQVKDISLRAEAQQLLITMGRHSVIPISTALLELDPAGQEAVAEILGRIDYRMSLPYLAEVAAATQSEQVRAAAGRAMQRLGGAAGADVAALYTSLGERYYAAMPEVTSFPGEPHQLLWAFDPAVGLHMTGVRTEVYHEAMAMRMTERSLGLRPQGNDAALALWLASNFSREIDTPAGYENPAYPSDRRDAMYFAVAAGAGLSQNVLARAIDTSNTPLARRAIAAVERTAGGAALWERQAGRMPLIEALRYPNRRVQYEAALALGRAQPTRSFEGSDRVVPILASAIRDASDRFAVVLANDVEFYQSIRRVLEGEGWTVLPFGRRLEELAQPIAETPGIDLVLTAGLTVESTRATIGEVRGTARLQATPVLALTSAQGYIDLGRHFDRDVGVSIRPVGLDERMISGAVTELMEVATGGPITTEEARDYASRSLMVLRDLAVSNNTVLDVSHAALPLMAALNQHAGPMRLDVAEVLSRIAQKRVQMALMDAALAASGEERVALLGKAADSSKRFGNLLEARQVNRVIELASSGSGDEATAAAAMMGALNLPNTDLIPLVLGKRSQVAGSGR